ncbi:MAG TPA: winged helix-turn-helix transcriptional regulator [Nitrososphaeraceae archaeon]
MPQFFYDQFLRETIKKQTIYLYIVSLYKRYTIDEISRKVYSELSENYSGLSGVELANRTKVNRMTLAKYLDLMLAKGLVRKKKLEA